MLVLDSEGYSIAEIANKLDCPQGTVMSGLFRVRQKAQTALGTNYVDVKRSLDTLP